jgi:hypothetical protein
MSCSASTKKNKIKNKIKSFPAAEYLKFVHVLLFDLGQVVVESVEVKCVLHCEESYLRGI